MPITAHLPSELARFVEKVESGEYPDVETLVNEALREKTYDSGAKGICPLRGFLEHIPQSIDRSTCFSALREFVQEVSKDDRNRYGGLLEEKVVELRFIHEKLTAAQIELRKYAEGLREENTRLAEEAERAREQEKRATDQFETQRKQLHVAVAGLILSLTVAAAAIQ